MKKQNHKIRARNILLVGISLVIVAVIVARVLAPSFILKRINGTLATISPIYKLHVADLDLSFIRMLYSLEGINGTLKGSGAKFLEVERVDVSIAWKELFRGRVLTKVDVYRGDVVISQPLFAESKTPEAKPVGTAQGVAATLFPVSVARVGLHNSVISVGALIGQPDSEVFKIREIEGTLRNLTPQTKDPTTDFTISGKMLEASRFKASGLFNKMVTPVSWKTRAEVHEFNLPQSNPLLAKYLSLSFKDGSLDVFAQTSSKGGRIEGYIKPFFERIELVGDRKDFKGFKHWGIEVLGATANSILRKSDDKTVATKIEFSKDPGNELQIKTNKAISRAIDHGFGEPLERGFDATSLIMTEPVNKRAELEPTSLY